MQFSESITKIAPAFIKAKAAFLKASKDSDNPFFESKYANLDSYIDGSAAGLAENDLAILQDCSGYDGKVCLATMIMHSSGEWIMSESLEMIAVDKKPVTYGSLVTYARRYSLSSMLGMGSKDDDDGVKASGQGTTVVTARSLTKGTTAVTARSLTKPAPKKEEAKTISSPKKVLSQAERIKQSKEN
jgi:hypothetical protein